MPQMRKMGGRLLKIKTVIFDLDGTLIDSGRDIVNAVNKTLENFNIPTLSEDIILSYVGEGVELLIERSIKEENMYRFEEILKFYVSAYNEECIKSTSLFPGVEKVLKELKENNINLALATNKSVEFIEKILSNMDILKYFHVIMGPENVTKRKPDPEIVHKILEKVNGEHNSTLIVGDSKFDIICGRNAGIYTCGVTYGIGSIESLIDSDADFLIHNIEKLLLLV